MKYGIYELVQENITSYAYFNLKDDKEAQALGYRKIAEARTKLEAKKLTPDWKVNW